jgi:hypothetical protein
MIPWLRDKTEAVALHCLVRAALRVAPPPRALRWVTRAARVLPPLQGADEARALRSLLGRSGSCLTRAITIASRLPGGEVVIGLDPWGATSPRAHAWVELGGVRIDASDGETFWFGEVARMRVGARVGGRERATAFDA